MLTAIHQPLSSPLVTCMLGRIPVKDRDSSTFRDHMCRGCLIESLQHVAQRRRQEEMEAKREKREERDAVRRQREGGHSRL